LSIDSTKLLLKEVLPLRFLAVKQGPFARVRFLDVRPIPLARDAGPPIHSHLKVFVSHWGVSAYTLRRLNTALFDLRGDRRTCNALLVI